MKFKVFLWVMIFSEFTSLQGQTDTLKNKNIYSFSLLGIGGTSYTLGNMPTAYFNTMKKGTMLENYNLKLIQNPERINSLELGANMGWKLMKFKSSLFSFCEYSTGVSFLKATGYGGKFLNTQYKDTGVLGGFYFSGLKWINRVAVHTKPFLKHFALYTALDVGLGYFRIGRNLDADAFLAYRTKQATSEEIYLYYTQSTLYSFGFPVSLKYNLSCDANLEFFYKPEFLCFPTDILKPANYAHFNTFGIQIRYKLNTTPALVNNKRTDIFF